MADWRSKLARGLFPIKNRSIRALKKNYCQQDLSSKGKVPGATGVVTPFLNQGIAIWKAALQAAAYVSNAETVPYSKRTRLLMLPARLKKKSSTPNLDLLKEQYKDKVLPYDHPSSVRVRSIKNRLIEALERDLIGDRVWPVWGGLLNRNKESYLDFIQEWETVVIDDPDEINAIFVPGGTIAVYTGLINYLASDAELAVPIAHEIGHGVGRHGAESYCWATFLALPALLLLRLDYFATMGAMRKHPSYLSLAKKLELEADYIGLLLMASAGYDPSIGLKLLEKQAKRMVEVEPIYPSLERRVELAAKAQEEAMAFYKESKVHYIKHQ